MLLSTAQSQASFSLPQASTSTSNYSNNNHQQTLPALDLPSLTQLIQSKLVSIEHLKAKLEYTLTKSEGKRKVAEETVFGELNNSLSIEEKRSILVDKLEQIKLQLESRRGTSNLKKIIVKALDASYASTSDLSSDAITRETEAYLSRKKLIEKRDKLALELSTTRNQTDLLLSERTLARKRLLALNRLNVTLSRELSSESIEKRIMASMSGDLQNRFQDELSRLKESTARNVIVRKVFQLLVLESGVTWYKSSELADDEGNSIDDEISGMSDRELLSYMIDTGN